MKKNVIVLAAISALMFAACAQKENQPGGVEVTPEIVGEDCNEFISFAGDTYTYSFTASHQWLVSGQSAMGAALDFDYEVTCTPAAGDAGVNSIAITFPENLTGADIDVSITISLMVNGSTVGTPSKTINFTVGKVGLEYGGVSYKIVKLKDGKWWMAENLRYVPEGITPSSDLKNVTAGVYYPIALNSDKTGVEFSTDDAVIQRNGYLYQSEVALGLNVGDLTSVEQAQALEGAQGICPEGWHIPTSAEILGLVGKSASLTTNTAAPYYDNTSQNGQISLINADGFNVDAYGAVSIQDNTKTAATLMGYLQASPGIVSSGYICGSSYAGVSYNTKDDASSGVKNLQFHAFMPMASIGTLNGSKLSYRIAASVRCVKD